MTKAMTKKKVTKLPPKKAVEAVQRATAPQQPVISNEQYQLSVMTDRCKTLEQQLIRVAQELGRMKEKYEPKGKEAKADAKK